MLKVLLLVFHSRFDKLLSYIVSNWWVAMPIGNTCPQEDAGIQFNLPGAANAPLRAPSDSFVATKSQAEA